MKIFVKHLNGTITTLDRVKASDTINEIMTMIQDKTGIPPFRQVFFYNGEYLKGIDSIARDRQCNMKDGDTLHLVLRLGGGPGYTSRLRDGIFKNPALATELAQRGISIRKAMVQINRLHASVAGNELHMSNKVVGWIQIKDKHADKIIKTVGEFCLCQKVKLEAFESDKEYVQALKTHHDVMHTAFKVKTSVAVEDADRLEHALVYMLIMYK